MRVALGLLLLLVVVAVPLGLAVQPHLPAAERGRRLAERTGCFACHGPGGQHGAANPGRNDKTVPDFDDDDMMMYAKSTQEVREWIEDGVTKTKANSATWREQRKRGALRMPPFERRLGPRQIDDLVAYVAVMAEMHEPDDSTDARHGLERAEALGCVGCHGPGGRLAQRNPGSLKGYVPSWDGADFPDLVHDRTEFGEWVEHGISKRFEKNALATHFLRRAVLHMPAYGERLAAGDVDALWTYVRWLRETPAAATSAPVESTSAHHEE
jgi:mono/diheme cytochrome c family protein